MSSGVSLTSWEEDASLILDGHSSSDDVTKNTLGEKFFTTSLFEEFATPR